MTTHPLFAALKLFLIYEAIQICLRVALVFIYGAYDALFMETIYAVWAVSVAVLLIKMALMLMERAAAAVMELLFSWWR